MENVQPAVASGTPLFFYKLKDEQKGPYTYEQLNTIRKGGQITADAVYRLSDSEEWRPISALCSPPDEITRALLLRVKRRAGFVERVKAKEIIRKIAVGVVLVFGLYSLLTGIFADKEAIKSELVNSRSWLQQQSEEGRVFNNQNGDEMSRRAAEVSIDLQYHGRAVESVIEGRVERGLFLVILSIFLWFRWQQILDGLPYLFRVGWVGGIVIVDL